MDKKLTLAALVALLLCTLATSEFPELVNLVDDTSNDYSLVVFVKDAPTVIKVQVGMLPQGSMDLTDTQRRPAAPSHYADALIQPIHTPEDMLHLLCVQRT